MICRIGGVSGAAIFNLYHEWFMKVSRTSAATIDATIPIRFRGFGNESAKQAAWERAWRNKNPSWDRVSQVTVSSDPPEIWFDLRETAEGLLLPPHIVGHEVLHAIKLKISDVINPDTFAGWSA